MRSTVVATTTAAPLGTQLKEKKNQDGGVCDQPSLTWSAFVYSRAHVSVRFVCTRRVHVCCTSLYMYIGCYAFDATLNKFAALVYFPRAGCTMCKSPRTPRRFPKAAPQRAQDRLLPECCGRSPFFRELAGVPSRPHREIRETAACSRGEIISNVFRSFPVFKILILPFHTCFLLINFPSWPKDLYVSLQW